MRSCIDDEIIWLECDQNGNNKSVCARFSFVGSDCLIMELDNDEREMKKKVLCSLNVAKFAVSASYAWLS